MCLPLEGSVVFDKLHCSIYVPLVLVLFFSVCSLRMDTIHLDGYDLRMATKSKIPEDFLVDKSALYLQFSLSSFVDARYCRDQPFSVVVTAASCFEKLPPKVLGVALDLRVEIADLWACDCRWVDPGRTGFLLNWFRGSDEVDKMLVFSAHSPSFSGVVSSNN